MITLKNKSIRFYDLSDDYKNALVDETAQKLRLEATSEGCEFIKKAEHAGKTWQRAYCEEYLIGYSDWKDKKINSKHNDYWEGLVAQEFEFKALNLLSKFFALRGDVDLF